MIKITFLKDGKHLRASEEEALKVALEVFLETHYFDLYEWRLVSTIMRE